MVQSPSRRPLIDGIELPPHRELSAKPRHGLESPICNFSRNFAALSLGGTALFLFGISIFFWRLHSEKDSVEDSANLKGAVSLGDSNVPMIAENVASAVNHFGLSLLSSLSVAGAVSNAFISPLSISSALGMMLLGATPEGNAASELLGVWSLDTNLSNSFLNGLSQTTGILADTSGGQELLNANSVWCKGSIREEYIKSVQDAFQADAKPLPESPDPINKWCSDATNGMVPSIVDSIDPSVAAILVNAVYFKGMWAKKFSEEVTALANFTSTSNEIFPCAMMKRTDERMLYAEHDGVQVIELPYGDQEEHSRISAVVMLPRKGTPVSRLVGELGAAGGIATFTDILQKLRPTHVALELPRFKLEFGVRDLTEDLRSSFHIRQAFDGQGQFLAMSEDRGVHLSAVLHKAVVEVNEAGTKAAAATAAKVTLTAVIVPEAPTSMVVDHPFLFLIQDRASRMILFAGVADKPEFDTTGL